MTTPFVSLDEFKSWLRAARTNVSIDDPELDLVLDSACREVVAYCGREFNRDTTVSARRFHAASTTKVRVDDISTTTGLIVKTDDDDDGTAETTWTITTDFELEPEGGRVDGLSGFPYWRIVAVGSRAFPSARRPLVEVTARWGWVSIPDPVRRATCVLGAAIYTTRDAPTGNAGMGEFGMVRVPVNQLRMVEQALQPYRRIERVSGVG